jgi:hypothetical protein
MARKSKFKPVITRVKLNPEQAVLSCSCYNTGRSFLAVAYLDANSPSGPHCNSAKTSVTTTACIANGEAGGYGAAVTLVPSAASS